MKIEKEIVKELNAVTGRKLKLKDLLEWSTSEEAVTKNLQKHEEKVYAPVFKVWCAIPVKNFEPKELTIADVVEKTESWGKDHWSLLAYFETRCVDHRGVPDFDHMRINSKKRGFSKGNLKHAMGMGQDWDTAHGTKLKQGSVPDGNHDDYDVMEELEKLGFLNNVGSGINPVIKLTKLGKKVSHYIRLHKASDKNFNSFDLSKYLTV